VPQTRVIRPGIARWTLSGADVRPQGREWRRASPDQRAAYYPILARRAREAMVSQLLEGGGTDGNRMRRPRGISRQSYRDRGLEWQGPTMSPQHARSRFIATLTVVVRGARVVGTWPLEVARIASWHARGLAGRGRPYFDGGRLVGWRGIRGATTGIVRDFIGLSARWLEWAVRTASAEWLAAQPPVLPAPRPPRARRTPVLPPAPAPPPPARAPAIPPMPPPRLAGRNRAEELLERYPFLERYRPTDPRQPVALAPPPAPARPRAAREGIADRAIRAVRGFFGRLLGR
jgi:hypothetical protein